jgi:hypothetical protein
VRRLLVLLALVGVAGCGGTSAGPGTTTVPTTAAEPPLARTPAAPGEVLVRGEASPASHGPYRLKGRYLVRFEQYAPEDPRLDFAAQTAFVATLDRRPEQAGPGSVTLFEAAQRTGARRVRLDGRFFLDVGFGDFPYVIRLTPVSG